MDRSDSSKLPGFPLLEEDVSDDATIACPSVHLAEASPNASAAEPQVPEAEPTTRDVDPRRPEDDEEDVEDVETICDPKPGSRARQAAAPSSAVTDEADDAPDAPTLVPSPSPPRSSSHQALSARRIPAPSVRPHPALRALSSQPVEPHPPSRPLPPRPRLPSESSLPMSERLTLRPPPLREEDDASGDELPTIPRDAKTSEPGADAPTLARRPSSVNHRVAFPAPQFSPPRNPQPFVVPSAPLTQRMVDDETRVGIVKKPAHLAQSPSGPIPFVNLQAPSSIAPVAMTTLPLGSRGDLTVKFRNRRRFTPAAAMAVSALVGLLVTGAVGLVAFVPGVRATVSGSSEKAAAASPPAPEPPPPSTVIVPPPPTHVPPVSLDLRPPVEPDMTYVTFPDSAQGHRVYVDGQLLSTGAEPTKIKCGPHTIKIGAAGKPKSVDLPCGDDYAFTE